MALLHSGLFSCHGLGEMRTQSYWQLPPLPLPLTALALTCVYTHTLLHAHVLSHTHVYMHTHLLSSLLCLCAQAHSTFQWCWGYHGGAPFHLGGEEQAGMPSACCLWLPWEGVRVICHDRLHLFVPPASGRGRVAGLPTHVESVVRAWDSLQLWPSHRFKFP